MAMVARALDATEGIEHRMCATAQHREMLDSVLTIFDLRPDYDLDVMVPDQDPTHVTRAVMSGMAPILADFQPDRVLVQGDTTTTLAASLASFHAKVPVGHVEAGLRSDDPAVPWPEEMNRRLTDRLSDRHYAPTERARENLLAEGHDADAVLVTGNTGVDALHHVAGRLAEEPTLRNAAVDSIPPLDRERRLLLVTAHRRENIGSGLAEICDALTRLAARPDVEIVYPVHPNPEVCGPVRAALSGRAHVHLIEPLGYAAFVHLMTEAHVIVTDSGGIQEEAPALGKPILVMRDVTERPEAVDAGTARLIGADSRRIEAEVERLLEDPVHHDAMARGHNPYGDGYASGRIAKDLGRRSEASEIVKTPISLAKEPAFA